jgi:hypothetical protein
MSQQHEPFNFERFQKTLLHQPNIAELLSAINAAEVASHSANHD